MSDGKNEPDREAPRFLEPDRDLVFYYNRERRLERASPEVRAVNEGRPLIKGGFVRSLTSTKPHQILFVTILLISVWILVVSTLSRGGLSLGGNTLKVRAGGGAEPFVLVTKSISPGEEAPYTGVVYVGVSPYVKSSGNINPADIPVFTDQIFFTLEREEEYRLDLPFGAERYLLLFQAGDRQVSTRVKAGD